jgi:hypothetical protein
MFDAVGDVKFRAHYIHKFVTVLDSCGVSHTLRGGWAPQILVKSIINKNYKGPLPLPKQKFFPTLLYGQSAPVRTDVQTQYNGQIAAQNKIKSCPP